MLKVKDIELPFFYGFYNSPLENDDEIFYEIGDERVFGFNAKAYRNEIVNCFTEVSKNYLPDWIEEIEAPELDSPKEYNFRTDRIYVTATLTDDWKQKMADFFRTNDKWLSERIKRDWTSRNGFHSFIYNNINLFCTELLDAEPRYLSIVLQYAIELNTGKDYYSMQWQLTDNTLEEFWKCNTLRDYVYKIEKNNTENNEADNVSKTANEPNTTEN